MSSNSSEHLLDILKEQSNLLNKTCQQFQTELKCIITDTNIHGSIMDIMNKLCANYSASLNKICIHYLIRSEAIISFNNSHSFSSINQPASTIDSYSLNKHIPHKVSTSRRQSYSDESDNINDSSEDSEYSTSSSYDTSSSSQNSDDSLPPLYRCGICNRSFKTARALCGHQKTHNTSNSYCTLCKHDFRTTIGLKEHFLQKHSNQRPHKCDRCDKSFKLKRKVYAHVREAHNGYPFKCDKCNTKFKYAKQLRKHRKNVHIDTRTGTAIQSDGIECRECDKICKDKMELNRHRNKVHSVFDPNPFKCDICNKVYGSFGSLKAHKLTHKDRKGNIQVKERFKETQCTRS